MDQEKLTQQVDGLELKLKEMTETMWLKEVPEHDTPTQRWRKEWARLVRDAEAGPVLAMPPTRAEVLSMTRRSRCRL